MKYYDKNKDSLYLQYWDVNNLYGREMTQKLPVKNFKQITNISTFDGSFVKSYNEKQARILS